MKIYFSYILTTVVLFLIPIFYSTTQWTIDGMFLVLYLFAFSIVFPKLIYKFNNQSSRKLRNLFIGINLIGSALYIGLLLSTLSPGF
jgi:hypothetical protein